MAKEMESVNRRNMKEEMPRLVTEQIRRTTEMEELFTHSTFVSTVNMPAIAWIQLWRVKSQLLFLKSAIKENK